MKYDDGVLTLHQSDISHYVTCPEQFRVVNHIGPGAQFDDEPTIRVETDAATIGTCLHAAIERELSGKPFSSLAAAQKWATDWMGETVSGFMSNGIVYRTESYGDDPAKAVGAVCNLVESWFVSEERAYWLQRDPASFLIENYFNIPFVKRTGDRLVREIRLAGTADIIDIAENRVVDWKSSGREYRRWEKQRWAHQPTVYTYAAASMGYILPDGDGLYRFDYRIFIRRASTAEAQSVSVFRGNGQWSWLTMLVNNIADQIESNSEMWPLRDDHALCGPKWCPVWDSCKGMFVGEDWA